MTFHESYHCCHYRSYRLYRAIIAYIGPQGVPYDLLADQRKYNHRGYPMTFHKSYHCCHYGNSKQARIGRSELLGSKGNYRLQRSLRITGQEGQLQAIQVAQNYWAVRAIIGYIGRSKLLGSKSRHHIWSRSKLLGSKGNNRLYIAQNYWAVGSILSGTGS